MSRVELYREGEVWHSSSELVRPPQSAPIVKWRWRFVSNGHTLADSGQGYSRRIDALNGCAVVLDAKFHTAVGLDGYVGFMARFPRPLIPVADLTKAKP